MGEITLLNMDCLDYMKEQRDKSFDLAICDPPYGINRFKSGASYVNKYGKPGKWNDNKPNAAYFDELFRVSSIQIIWGANNFTLPQSEYFLIWDKIMTGKHNFAECELAWVGGDIKMPAKIFKMAVQSTGENKIHPTQKPVKLYEWLLRNYAEPGQRILDTHLGSGSSAIAAHYFGVDFVGIEIDEDYYNAAVERFNNETKQVTMF